MADAEFTREFGFGETEEQLAQYLEDVAKFRDSYYEKMASLGQADDAGWAYFELDESDWPAGVLTDVCLWHARVSLPDEPDREVPSHIRILSSEEYAVDGVAVFLTTDVTVDYEDDAICMVGPITKEAAMADKDDDSDRSDVSRDPGNPSVPFFYVKNGNLYMAPKEQMKRTQPGIITYTYPLEDGQGVENRAVVPFGFYDRLADKTHALSVARHVLEMVSDYLPKARANGN
ncbi:MAG: hypothetical protein QG553_250 [Patescibacteria group bacterium]|nr:hypothetical protein [Patescibacteria group bacterium]